MRSLCRAGKQPFDGDEFYARIKGGLAVTTSQITPQHYADFFEPFLKEGQDVLYVSMSSGISGSCDCARVAAQMLSEEHPDRIVGIAQAGCREDAKYLMELLRKEHPPKEILPVEYEPVTGSHVGPGALALFFLSNETVRFEC